MNLKKTKFDYYISGTFGADFILNPDEDFAYFGFIG